MRKLVGRKEEIAILKDALKSNRSELVVVHGRRRVGKTFLIRKVYAQHLIFEFSGVHKASLSQQLKNFHFTLSDIYPGLHMPQDWIEAFYLLGKSIDRSRVKRKKVIFIDEFPWLDTHKSGFLSAFDNFWNSYANKRDDLVIVVCGSAASYMVKNIIKSKGGLHNRLTRQIKLDAFNLYETELLLRRNNVNLSQYEIVQIYMMMGGIPYYLEQINRGESVAQAIDRLCFKKDGFLRTEFDNVFASLFTHHENHEAIIRTLAKVRKGLTRTVLFKKAKISSGGTLTKTLDELEHSGFINKYLPYKGSKDALYRVTDEYSIFYVRYIENTKPSRRNIWSKLQGQPSYRIWSGYSFETICIKHIDQIKEGLKIGGIHSTHGSWIEKAKPKGAQIDMLIDRDDNVINLCEMKFYNTQYVLTKKWADEMAQKVDTFQISTKTKKSIFITYITTFGLKPNQYSRRYVQNELTLRHLFVNIG